MTNAHVAGKALKLKGKDDYGTEFNFTHISGYDANLDIAVVRAERAAEVDELPLVPRPGDPKELRGTKVLAIGNTGGQGLSRYTGEITNVVGEPAQENLVHSADISSGSSGGPLYNEESGELLGINKSINLALRQSFATPAWLVQGVIEKGKGSGVPLTEAFEPKNFPITLDVKRECCLEPGQKLVAPVNIVGVADLVALVNFTTEGTPLFFGMIRGDQLMSKGVLTQNLVAAWSLPGSGVYAVILVNPPPRRRKPAA